MNIYNRLFVPMACVAAVLLASSCSAQDDVDAIPSTPAPTSVDMPEQTPFNKPTDESDDLWLAWRSDQEVPPNLVELGQSCVVLIQDRGVAEDGTIYAVTRIIPRSKRQFDAVNYNRISGYGIAAEFGRLKTDMHGITCQM